MSRAIIYYMKKRGVWLDIILVVIAMAASILVRIPSAFKDTERFRQMAFPNEVSQEFVEEFRTEEDNPYLYDPDSYFYSKQAQDLDQEPSILSNFGEYNLLPFITVTTHKILNLVANISLETLIVYIGPIIFSFSCIPAYIFIKRKTNRIGGFTAALLLGVSPILVAFSMATRFDTDILLTLLPATMICSFLLAIETKSNKKTILGLIIATISFFLLAFTWEKCLIYALLAVLISFIVIFSSLIKNKFNIKTTLSHKEPRVALIFTLILILVSILMHSHITSVLGTAILTISGSDGSFPSPGAYVSELNSCPLYSGDFLYIFDTTNCGVVNLLGAFPLIILLGVLIVLFTQENFSFLKNRCPKQNPLFLTSTTLIIWLLVGVISSGFGMRFIKNAAIPAALLAGLGIGIAYQKFHTSPKNKIILLLSWCLICLPSFRAYKIPLSTIPSANDSLAEAASWMNENLDEDYTIASWWDLGYYYEYSTNLKVLADGGTYNSHVYYWLANAFITEDEVLSSRILKMLSSSNLQAPEFAKSIVGSYAEGSKILRQILVMPKEEARDALIVKYNFTPKQADTLLGLTHQDSKVVIVITKDMLSIIDSITYFGCWSFNGQFQSPESACKESNQTDKYDDSTLIYSNNDLNSNQEKSNDHPSYLIYRLYHNEQDTELFKHSIRINDPTNVFSSNIWVLK